MRPYDVLVRCSPWAVAAGAAGFAGYVAVVDPNRPGHYPICPFLALTGYYCPGCGTLRAIHALTHGHLVEAVGHNPLALAALPPLAWLWTRWARGRPMPAWILRPSPAIGVAVLTVCFWVVRNLPVGHMLSP